MKKLHASIILLLSLNCFSQKQHIENWSHPFQVLFVDSTNLIGAQRELNQFDFIRKYDLVEIHDRLTLLHFTGKIIELADTTIIVSQFSKSYFKEGYWDRPIISDTSLFINKSIDYRSRLKKGSGVVYCGVPELKIVYPQFANGELWPSETENVHLIWEAKEDSESYIVRFQNIFDENILTVKVDSTQIILPREKLPKDELAIVEISTEDKKYSTGYFALKFKEAEKKSAIRKLIDALTEQWIGNKYVSNIYFKEALEQSSNDPRFLNLYQKFLERNPTLK